MLLAGDIMNRDVITVPATMAVGDLADLFQRLNIHAAPVLAPDGSLVGMVAHDDILYGTMGGSDAPASGPGVSSAEGMLEIDELSPEGAGTVDPWARPVSDVMTPSAIFVAPETPVAEACRLMWTLRIHHLPIVEEDRVVGLISSLDVCHAVAEERLGG
jgi:CBS domain-containing protein